MSDVALVVTWFCLGVTVTNMLWMAVFWWKNNR